jgi:predicted transcriptional regulator
MDTTPIERRLGRRSRFEILCDILKVVSNGADKPTRIMQVANLTRL